MESLRLAIRYYTITSGKRQASQSTHQSIFLKNLHFIKIVDKNVRAVVNFDQQIV